MAIAEGLWWHVSQRPSRPKLRPKLLQPLLLSAVSGEIGGIEPGFVSLAQGGPFLVEDRIPGGVAVLALDDHVLAENAFELKAEPRRRALGRFVAVVAFPFIAAIAQIVEDMAREQKLRLGRPAPARHPWPPIDMADLDHPVRGIDAHQGLAAHRLAARLGR